MIPRKNQEERYSANYEKTQKEKTNEKDVSIRKSRK